MATPRIRPAAPGAKVTWLELFYDLVFVFAFIHVNTASAKHLDPSSLLAIFLLLAALWLAWSRFAVLGNNVRADQGVMPVVGFAIMTAIFVSVAAVPELRLDAPTERPDVPLVIPGEFVFPVCYSLIWVLEILALRHAARSYPWLRQIWWKSAPALTLSTVLLALAAFVPQQLDGTARIASFVVLWGFSIGIAYLAAIRPDALTVVSAGHWAERHAQIVLIALGESVISLGLGSNLLSSNPLTVPVLVAALLGIVLICALWWAYFDVRSFAAQQVLHRTSGIDRTRLARDAYTVLHFPMVFGIILLSLGLKQVLAYLASETDSAQEQILDPVHLRVLYGGVVLYLAGLLAFQARTVRTLHWTSVAPALLLVALLPVAAAMPALVALAVLAVVTVTGVILENVHARPQRQAIRDIRLAEQQALESTETDWRRRQD